MNKCDSHACPPNKENKKSDEISSDFATLAVWTGLEPATLGVTGRYSNQTELPHQKRRKINSIFYSSK